MNTHDQGSWSRKTVSYSFCVALPYAHSHCPCERCNGKAVSRYTEYKHCKDSKALASASQQRISDASLESTNSATSISTATVMPTGSHGHVTAANMVTMADVSLAATTCNSTSVTSEVTSIQGADSMHMYTSTTNMDLGENSTIISGS